MMAVAQHHRIIPPYNVIDVDMCSTYIAQRLDEKSLQLFLSRVTQMGNMGKCKSVYIG